MFAITSGTTIIHYLFILFEIMYKEKFALSESTTLIIIMGFSFNVVAILNGFEDKWKE